MRGAKELESRRLAVSKMFLFRGRKRNGGTLLTWGESEDKMNPIGKGKGGESHAVILGHSFFLLFQLPAVNSTLKILNRTFQIAIEFKQL